MRGLIALLAAAGAVVLAAVPALAADGVDVNLSGLSSSMTPGARADSFTVRAQNRMKVDSQLLRRVFIIRMAGLGPEGIRISRGVLPLSASGSDGQVTVVDPLAFVLGREGSARDSSTASYGIQILAGAPGGRATITAEVVSGSTVLGSDSDTITIKGTAVQPSSSIKTLGPSDSGVIPTFETNGPQSFAAIEDKSAKGVGSGGFVALYITGGLLVVVGGVTLWLLFRRRPQLAGVESGYPSGEYEAAAPSLGYPAAPPFGSGPLGTAPPTGPGTTAPLHVARPGGPQPTAVLPAVRDAHTPPAADPWSSSAPPQP